MMFVSDECRYTISTDRRAHLLRGVADFFGADGALPIAALQTVNATSRSTAGVRRSKAATCSHLRSRTIRLENIG